MTKTPFIAVALLCASCSSVKPPAAALAEDDIVKIVNFYARDGELTEGKSTVLCYAVENAKTVSMEPPVAEVWPSRNRCFEVQPKHESTYTLKAEGADGKTVSQSLSVQVTADTSELPKISSFRIESCSKDYAGKPVFKVNFAAGNVVEVSIDPPAFQTLHGSPFGEFYVSPEKTTTYTLSVTGKFGHVAKRTLTLDTSQCK